MDRLTTILKNLRRRDNIRDFIDGLHDSECWPYPDGETYSTAATNECNCCGESYMIDVELRDDKLEELTHLFITNVHRYHPLATVYIRSQDEGELTHVSLESCPDEGSGAYSVGYEVVDKTECAAAPKLNLHDVAAIRSAFIHRREWVLNKLHSVNEERLDACTRLEEALGRDLESEVGSECQSQEPLSEEEDHDFLLCDDDRCEPGDESEQDEDDLVAEPELVVVKPYKMTASGSPLPSAKSDFNVALGCIPAFGPSPESQLPDRRYGELSLEVIRSFVPTGGDGATGSMSRKRGREL